MSGAGQHEEIGDFVKIEREGRITSVVFDRGDQLNTLSVQLMEELKTAAEVLARETTCSAIVLRGGNAFSAGADLADPALHSRDELPLIERREAVRLGPDLCDAWARLEQITIAAIEGFCVGGGLALAVACDHRIAGANSHFRLPEIPLGMNMSWRSIPRIVALIGPSRAKQLVVLGRRVNAEEASQWGLVDRIVPDGSAAHSAYELAQDYCGLPPVAARMAKEAIEASAHSLAYATSFMDRDQFLLSRTDEDHIEAVRAFKEKSAPKFRGQ